MRKNAKHFFAHSLDRQKETIGEMNKTENKYES